jgi:hypothetical protein
MLDFPKNGRKLKKKNRKKSFFHTRPFWHFCNVNRYAFCSFLIRVKPTVVLSNASLQFDYYFGKSESTEIEPREKGVVTIYRDTTKST